MNMTKGGDLTMVKKSDVVNYVNSLIGKQVDMDGVHGSQCMDLTVHVMNKFFHWWPTGNAIVLTTQAIPAGFQRLRVYQSIEIQAGDVIIWGLGVYAQYGHTAIAVENGRADNTFVSVDQNWVNASLEVGSSAQSVKHTMDGVWGVIRPKYEPIQKSVNQTTKKHKQKIQQKRGETTMYCLYQRPINPKTGALEWNGSHWATFFCNGINCRRLYHEDEIKVIQDVYKANNEKDIPFYGQDKWNKNAPWYNRLESICPVIK